MAADPIDHEVDKFIDKLKWAFGIMISIAKMGPDFVRYKMIPWAFGKSFEWGREKWRESRLKNKIERADLTIKYRPEKAKKEGVEEQKAALQKQLAEQQNKLKKQKNNNQQSETKVEENAIGINTPKQESLPIPKRTSSLPPGEVNSYETGGRGQSVDQYGLNEINGNPRSEELGISDSVQQGIGLGRSKSMPNLNLSKQDNTSVNFGHQSSVKPKQKGGFK